MSSTHFAEVRYETLKREFDYVLSPQFTRLISHNKFRPSTYSCHPCSTSTLIVYHFLHFFLPWKCDIFTILLRRKL